MASEVHLVTLYFSQLQDRSENAADQYEPRTVLFSISLPILSPTERCLSPKPAHKTSRHQLLLHSGFSNHLLVTPFCLLNGTSLFRNERLTYISLLGTCGAQLLSEKKHVSSSITALLVFLLLSLMK